MTLVNACPKKLSLFLTDRVVTSSRTEVLTFRLIDCHKLFAYIHPPPLEVREGELLLLPLFSNPTTSRGIPIRRSLHFHGVSDHAITLT